MNRQKFLLSVVLSIVGLIIWMILGGISGEAEAWDSMLYLLIGLPLMFAATFIAGYIEPKHSLIWGILVVLPQPVIMFTQGPSGPFGFIGIFIFGIIAAAAGGFAGLGKMAKTSRKNKSL